MMGPKYALPIGLVFLLIATAFLTIPIATADPPASGDWTIAQDAVETVTGQTFDLDGNIIVEQDGTLTITNSVFTIAGNITIEASGTATFTNTTIIFICDYDDHRWLDVEGGAELLMQGCTLRSQDDTYRYGMEFQASADVELNGCTITDVHSGIEIWSDIADINNNYISNSDYGIEAYGSPDIENNYIHHNTDFGIYVHNGASPDLLNNQIYFNGHYGIYNHEGTPHIEGNNIYNNYDSGIQSVNVGPTAYTITDNTIRYNMGNGIYLDDTSPTISDNIIEGNTGNGIQIYGDQYYLGATDIDSSVITGNGGHGIWLDNHQSNASVDNCVIYHNLGWGIYARGGHLTGDMNSNGFLDTRGIGNRQGQITQYWNLFVDIQDPDDAGLYLYNDIFNPSPWFVGDGHDDYNFGWRLDSELYNDGTSLDTGTYFIVADETGGNMMATASTTLDDNTNIVMTLANAPDVGVSGWGFSNPTPSVGDTVTTTIDIQNWGGADATNCDVDVYVSHEDGTEEFISTEMVSVAQSTTEQINVDFTFDNAGRYTFRAVVDPDNDFWEEDDTEANPNNIDTQDLDVDGMSAYIRTVRNYIDEPHWWGWTDFTEQDVVSTDPNSWETFQVRTSKYHGATDQFNIILGATTWEVKASFEGNPSTTNLITDYTMNNGWNQDWYLHVRPPADAPRGDNLNLDITVQSDNDNTVEDTYHLDCYANWVIPEGTTETASTEVLDIGYSIRVYGELQLTDCDWTFNNYPQVKFINIEDGGKAVIDNCKFNTLDQNWYYRFRVYGDMNLTNSDIEYAYDGIEIYTIDYPAEVVIKNNNIRYSNDDGIVIDEATALIQNNVIEYNNDAGIHGNDAFGSAMIRGNTIRNNGEGIDCGLKSKEMVEITGNRIYDNNIGVMLHSFTEAALDSNKIYANNYGIELDNHAYITANEDLLMLNGNDGLNMDTHSIAELFLVDIEKNGRYGIWANYNCDVEGQFVDVISNGQSALYIDDSDVELADSVVGMMSTHGGLNNIDDIYLVDQAYVSVLNTTLDRTRVFFEDDNGSLLINWYVQVFTVDRYDAPVSGIGVEIKDEADLTVFMGPTNFEGLTMMKPSREVLIENSGMTYFKHHTAAITNGATFVEHFNLTTNTIYKVPVFYAMDSSIDLRVQNALPLESVEFNLTIQNLGAMEDTYDLEVIGNTSWLPEIDREFIQISSGSVRNVFFTATVPKMALALHNESFELSITSQSDGGVKSTLHASVIVDTIRNVEVTPVDSDPDLLPGGNLTKEFQVMNTGNIIDTFTITSTIAGSRIQEADVIITPATLMLDPWDSEIVEVFIEARTGVPMGAETITLRANSTAPAVGDSASAALNIEQVFGTQLTTLDDVDIIAGDSATFTFNITNTGNGPDVIVLSDDNNFTMLDVDFVDLLSGAETMVSITVDIPVETATSTELVTISALCGDDQTLATINFTLNITGRRYDILIEPDENGYLMEQGWAKEFDIDITNNGNHNEDVLVTYSGIGFNAKMDITKFDLNVFETGTGLFSFAVPDTAAVGTYTLVLKAAVNGRMFSKNVTINVVEKNVNVEISPVEPDSVFQGDAREATITITNTGNYTMTIYLTVSDPQGVTSLDVTEVTLDAGAFTTVTLYINPPHDAKTGDLAITFTAHYGLNSTKSTQQDITVNVKEKDRYTGWIVLSILLPLLGLIIGAVAMFFIVRMLLPPPKDKMEEDEKPEGAPVGPAGLGEPTIEEEDLLAGTGMDDLPEDMEDLDDMPGDEDMPGEDGDEPVYDDEKMGDPEEEMDDLPELGGEEMEPMEEMEELPSLDEMADDDELPMLEE